MLLIIISISLIYAALDEIHQYFVPGRFATFNDFLIDSAGILISSLFYISIKNFKK
ncbi:MAG: VanZ family protein [Minisyncoccales bacterium]